MGVTRAVACLSRRLDVDGAENGEPAGVIGSVFGVVMMLSSP